MADSRATRGEGSLDSGDAAVAEELAPGAGEARPARRGRQGPGPALAHLAFAKAVDFAQSSV